MNKEEKAFSKLIKTFSIEQMLLFGIYLTERNLNDQEKINALKSKCFKEI